MYDHLLDDDMAEIGDINKT